MEFPDVIVDKRVPLNELWMYTKPPMEVILPSGHRQLREPDAKIVNICEPQSKLDWVIAPH
jgi:hypothetical protein